jgi:catechol 2,3-dioxygenase-like lactoylglutathione lyase family enzyme
MSRVQLALNVPKIDEAVDFYSRLFATEPAKRRPGYANFAVSDPPLKLVLFEAPDAEVRLNHLGVEVADPAAVREHQARLSDEGIDAAEGSGTCCFATQEKVWIDAPDGSWEVYAVLADSETFGTDTAAQVPDVAEAGDALCCATVPSSEGHCCT